MSSIKSTLQQTSEGSAATRSLLEQLAGSAVVRKPGTSGTGALAVTPPRAEANLWAVGGGLRAEADGP